MGGPGSERAGAVGFSVGSAGNILFCGDTQSAYISADTELQIKNLQHARMVEMNESTDEIVVLENPPGCNQGHPTGFAGSLSAAETSLSCLTCSDGTTATASIADGTCFIQNDCRAHGEASPHFACMACDADASQTSEQPNRFQAHCTPMPPDPPPTPPPPLPPPEPPAPPLSPGSRYAIDAAELVMLLDDTSVDRIVLAPGRFLLHAQLNVTRSVTIEAAVSGATVLDAGSWEAAPRLSPHVLFADFCYLGGDQNKNQLADKPGCSHIGLGAERYLLPGRRILYIDPPFDTDVIRLVGLNLTHGSINLASGTCGGAAACIAGGQVILDDCNIYDNFAPDDRRTDNGHLSIIGGNSTLNRCKFFTSASMFPRDGHPIRPAGSVRETTFFPGRSRPIMCTHWQEGYNENTGSGSTDLVESNACVHGTWVHINGPSTVVMNECEFAGTLPSAGRLQRAGLPTNQHEVQGVVAEGAGAGVFVKGGQLAVNACDFYDKTEDPCNGLPDYLCANVGSALHVSGGQVTVDDSNFHSYIYSEREPIKINSAEAPSSVAMNNCSIRNNTGVEGTVSCWHASCIQEVQLRTALHIYGSDTTVTMNGCTISSNRAPETPGGGIGMEDGALTMSQTLVHDNTALGGFGNIVLRGGRLVYRLPAPPGYWLPSTSCVANRAPCDSGRADDLCRSTPCSTVSGNMTNGWTPLNCPAPLAGQPCDWQTDACAAGAANCLLGHTVCITPASPFWLLKHSTGNDTVSPMRVPRCSAFYPASAAPLSHTLAPRASSAQMRSNTR